MCKVLLVSRSGYYKSLKKTNNKRYDKHKLLVLVKLIHQKARGAYGSRRMSKALIKDGYMIGRYQARALMKEANIQVKQRRRYKLTTHSSHNYNISDNQLNREFDVLIPNAVWAGDITYISTYQGWLYLAVVIDLYSRRVIGWSLSEHIDTELVCNALRMAVGRRKPDKGLMYHSDRGIQYASKEYQQLLKQHAIKASMSRKGNCWDNAVVERFFGSLKSECIAGKKYLTRQEAHSDIIDYIEMFYNSYRLHSTLGYLSPIQYETINMKFF
jgi:putative transposase